MAKRKLEEILFKDGRFVKKSTGETVYPRPLGNPIVGNESKYWCSRRTPYCIIADGAKAQNLWYKANAFAMTIKQIHDDDSYVSGQLYRIEESEEESNHY
ncbi:hypothetical protein HOK51_08820 [Candidatus Woesearchaeota archaeon]|jgi:hypothetical protein|nr:hypothetical protein [Candidatus Woesearchaeota archaeon]MBT6519930.1 hypothetical protein [Candidatus Woesearchaeota archaeon]MBT7367094.1 hypothetical protein [Candidatus Woesearchaeota archaeon]